MSRAPASLHRLQALHLELQGGGHLGAARLASPSPVSGSSSRDLR
jgi:hypothetical protein